MKVYLYKSGSRRECFALSRRNVEDNLPPNLGPWERHNKSILPTFGLNDQIADILSSTGYFLFFAGSLE